MPLEKNYTRAYFVLMQPALISVSARALLIPRIPTNARNFGVEVEIWLAVNAAYVCEIHGRQLLYI